MASTITALTGGGGVAVAGDTTGILELKTNNGTTAMTIDTSQNVGIGTSSPTATLDVNGNVAITGSARRITGDFSNATLANRAAFQTSTVNSATGIIAYPNGTSQFAGWYGFTNTTANASYIGLTVDGTNTNIVSDRTGTGSYLPMTFYTGGSERMRIASNGYVTNAVNGLGNGLVQAQQYYRLDSGLAGANVNTAQNIFGVGVTLVGSTVYEFEIQFAMSKTAGTTGHTIGLGFGGTATVNNIGYFVVGTFNNNLTGNASLSSAGGNYITTTANTTQTSNLGVTANCALIVIVKGTVSVNAGGTFIPQYTLSAAPGGAYTVQAGSYIKISPLSASGSNTSIGTWA